MSTLAQVKLLNTIAAVTGISCVLGCGLLVFIVTSQLSDLDSAILDAASSFQNESDSIWKSLKDVDINPNVLRNRRETFRQLLGRPLSTSTNIGFSNNQVLFKSVGSTERRRKPVTKKPMAKGVKNHPSPPAAPQIYSYGIQADSFPDLYSAGTTSGSNNPYGNEEATEAFGYGSTATTYAGRFEEAHVEEPQFEFEWRKIKPPTCQCNMDNTCPPGPPGPKGSRGQDGEPGDDGKPGDQGKIADDVLPLSPPLTHCIMCPQGEPGLQGAEGKRGSRGLRGVRGADGVPGRNGAPGLSGYHGPEGSPGVDGEMGPMGADGMNAHMLVGLPGSKGTPGTVGECGVPGEPGSNGQPGLEGVPGHRGAAGKAGQKGTDGTPGEPGIDGEPGQDAEYCACPRQRQYGSAATRLLRKA